MIKTSALYAAVVVLIIVGLKREGIAAPYHHAPVKSVFVGSSFWSPKYSDIIQLSPHPDVCAPLQDGAQVRSSHSGNRCFIPNRIGGFSGSIGAPNFFNELVIVDWYRGGLSNPDTNTNVCEGSWGFAKIFEPAEHYETATYRGVRHSVMQHTAVVSWSAKANNFYKEPRPLDRYNGFRSFSSRIGSLAGVNKRTVNKADGDHTDQGCHDARESHNPLRPSVFAADVVRDPYPNGRPPTPKGILGFLGWWISGLVIMGGATAYSLRYIGRGFVVLGILLGGFGLWLLTGAVLAAILA